MNQNPLVRLFYPHNRSGSHLWLICIISAQLLINNGQLPKKTIVDLRQQIKDSEIESKL